MPQIIASLQEALLQKAEEAAQYAYAPYSQLRVGAAVYTAANNIYLGCNVENASYSLTICAERVALTKAISNGEQQIQAIAIYTSRPDITPCGACRQFIFEFGEDIEVICRYKNAVVVQPVKELLPGAFHKEQLEGLHK